MRASQKSLSAATVEFDDVCAIDPLPIAASEPHESPLEFTHEPPQAFTHEPPLEFTHEPPLDDTVEIELTADQIEALLSGR
jgi:hypothetical protein